MKSLHEGEENCVCGLAMERRGNGRVSDACQTKPVVTVYSEDS